MSATIHEQFYKVDLNKALLRVDVGSLATYDENANCFGAELYKDGVAVDAAGLSVKGYFIRPDFAEAANGGAPANNTVILDGNVEGNRVYVYLDEACYEYDGAFTLTIKVTGNGLKNAVLVCDGTLLQSMTDTVISNNRVIYSLEELLEQIDAMETATTAASNAASSANTAATNANNATVSANSAAGAANDAADRVNGFLDDVPVIDDTQASPGHPWSGAKTKLEIEHIACRPNLLDNWYFENPVNQRGKTSYTGRGYTIDRWKISSGVTVETKNEYISIKNNITSEAWFDQTIDDRFVVTLQNKQVTLSVLTHEGVLYTNTDVFSSGHTASISTTFGSVRFVWGDKQLMIFAISAGQTANIVAVKAELGPTQTLAHLENGVWVLNKVPDYGEQLARCKRYYRLWTTGEARTEALKEVGIMRTTPVLGTTAIDGTTYYYASADL